MRTLVLFLGLLAAPGFGQSLAFDAHLDLPRSATEAGWSGLSDGSSQFDLERARSGGLNAASVALFVPQGPRDPTSLQAAQRELEVRHAAIQAIARRNPALAEIALSPTDVRRIVQSGRFAIVESLLNAWPLGNDLDAFDRWHDQGVRIVGFVHAGNNQFADSSRPALQFGDRPGENAGLSPLGRNAVQRLNDLGVLIDVSQLSDVAFDQVLALSRAPVIASHSDVRALVDSPRNLSDAQLDALKANGGVIGINAFSAYLRARSPQTVQAVSDLQRRFGLKAEGNAPLAPERQAEYDRLYHDIVGREPKASLVDLVNAIDYAVNRLGIDHVAISSDFNHGGGVTDWADVGETWAVTVELHRRGYGHEEIEKLWSGNLLRIWQAAIDAAAGHQALRANPLPSPAQTGAAP